MATLFIENQKEDTLTLKQLGEVLIKHFGYHEGLFDAAFEFRIGVGAVKQGEDGQPLPGVITSIGGVKLSKVEKLTDHTVNAALSNPLRKTKSKTGTDK